SLRVVPERTDYRGEIGDQSSASSQRREEHQQQATRPGLKVIACRRAWRLQPTPPRIEALVVVDVNHPPKCPAESERAVVRDAERGERKPSERGERIAGTRSRVDLVQ